MSQPLVTVVIPTYTPEGGGNPQTKLFRSIRSVTNQPYEPVEILVCDDGTPKYYGRDLVKETIEEVLNTGEFDTDVTITHHQWAHRSQAHVLNDGFALARGDYIFNLNDDDQLMHDFLDSAVGWLEKEENKEIGFLYSDYLFTYNWSEFAEATPKPEPWDPERLKVKQFCTVIGLLRSWVAKKCLFDIELDHEEDWDYLLRIAKVTKAEYLPNLYSYVVFLHSGQKSVKDDVGVARCTELIKKRIAEGYYD